MKKAIMFAFLLPFVFSCEKKSEKGSYDDSFFISRISGFDLNCSTCILDFSDDSVKVSEVLGSSPSADYNAVNLNKGAYAPGQLLRVKIRKPEPDEMRACITLYPSYNFSNVFITENEDFDNMILNDTTEIFYKDCGFHPEELFYLCLDAIEDSRCPEGATCFWEGNARVGFRFEKLNEAPVYFTLNTHFRSVNEQVIEGYRIKLINLLPYPSINSLPGSGGKKRALVVVTKL